MKGQGGRTYARLAEVYPTCGGNVNTILSSFPKYRKRSAVREAEEARGRGDKGELCRQRGIELIEGHLMPDHIHMCLSIPPKQSVAFAIGFIKGKSAVRIHRQILGKKKVTGLHFWSRGYCVSTVGLNEETIRKYIREQEALEKRQGELEFDKVEFH
ncbi:MAG: IS200/IS605 family transposase [Desulfobacterales bacterium]|nr:IS200/IS605 family transposase [Desulfobacterales bacterium]